MASTYIVKRRVVNAPDLISFPTRRWQAPKHGIEGCAVRQMEWMKSKAL